MPLTDIGPYQVGSIASAVKSAVKKVKKLGSKKNLRSMSALAKVVGPAIVQAYPAAGPGVAAATIALDAASKGDPKALATVENVQTLAKAGVPEAQEALVYLETAQNIQRNVAASQTLAAAQAGDGNALRQIATVQIAAQSGDPAAQAASVALQAAATGALAKQAGLADFGLSF
jgi:hypothetical protein